MFLPMTEKEERQEAARIMQKVEEINIKVAEEQEKTR